MPLDVSKLQNATRRGDGSVIAQCPACVAMGGDRKGEHLIIYADGSFGCVAYQEDSEHRKEVFRLAGKFAGDGKDKRGSTNGSTQSYRLKIRIPRYERVGVDGLSRTVRTVNLNSFPMEDKGGGADEEGRSGAKPSDLSEQSKAQGAATMCP